MDFNHIKIKRDNSKIKYGNDSFLENGVISQNFKNIVNDSPLKT